MCSLIDWFFWKVKSTRSVSFLYSCRGVESQEDDTGLTSLGRPWRIRQVRQWGWMGKEAKDINRTSLEIALIDPIFLGHRVPDCCLRRRDDVVYFYTPQNRQMITLNLTSARYSGVSVDFQNGAMELIRLERVLFISFYQNRCMVWIEIAARP